MSKRKKTVVVEEITLNAQAYLDLWIRLNSSQDEQQIDSIRAQMSLLWQNMTAGDIRDFHRESDRYDRTHKPFNRNFN